LKILRRPCQIIAFNPQIAQTNVSSAGRGKGPGVVLRNQF